jgi:chromate transporter
MAMNDPLPSVRPIYAQPAESAVSAGRVFREFLRLGLTSFGGPVAHIGYFRERFVKRLGWLEEASFADLVALCQFLPGPASSQVGMAIGLEKAGLAGAAAAFVGFTLPSAVIMALLALGLGSTGGLIDAGVLSGLAIVAVAVVAEAVRGMALSLATGRLLGSVALAAMALALLLPGSLVQIAILLAGGLVGYRFARPPGRSADLAPGEAVSRRVGVVALALFVVLLIGLPILAATTHSESVSLASGLYRAGALVFGGGHVVLPLLEDSVVASGLVPEQAFVAGYGAAQAMPGPLFSLSAYLGVAAGVPTPLIGGALAVLALFAPAILLVVGVLPFWRQLQRVEAVRRALAGVNAAVVGLLAAALYDPVFLTAIHGARDLAFAVLCYALLVFARLPAWSVVLLAAGTGWVIGD